MATSANKGGPKKVGFSDWLIEQINSGRYKGLDWTNESRTTFCIPWKHRSKKSLVADDYEIFRAWAIFSKKYNGVYDLTKWKTNFRCAMNSTKRFEELASNEPDIHVYRIIPPKPKVESTANLPSGTKNGSDYEAEGSHFSPYSEECPALHQSTHLPQLEIDAALQTLTLESAVPGAAVPNGNAAGSFYQIGDGTLRWVIQQSQLTEVQQVSWPPTVTTNSNNPIGNAVLYEQGSSCEISQVSQNGCLPIGNGGMVESVANSCYQEGTHWLPANTTNEVSQSTVAFPVSHAQQNFPGTNQFNQLGEAVYNTSCFINDIYLNEEPQENGVTSNEMRNGYPLIANQQAMMEQSTFAPSVDLPTDAPAINNVPSQDPVEAAPFIIAVSIYYREKLQDTAEVNSCMFTYNQQNCNKPHNAQIIRFPNPETLTDQKQIQHTLALLQVASLWLYQKNGRIWAKRLGTCKVFYAFSKELDNRSQDPPCKLLPRNVETEIFNYEQFFEELVEFRDGHRGSSPDYTIYLCFGQQFSASKPKESKLILVKLVPNFCKQWHEILQKEGFSSLNSENVSLQISNSLYDMIEQLSTIFMQNETMY